MIKNIQIVTALLVFSLFFAIGSYAQSGKLIIQGNDTTYYDIQPDADEYAILKDFFEKTGGTKWKKSTNWLKGKTSEDFSKWYGVTVEHGDVVQLVLDKNNLSGEVPQDLYKLIRLRYVSLEKNNLGGSPKKTTAESEVFKTKPSYGFIENKGQVVDQNNQPNDGVKYLLPLPNNNIVLKQNGFSYDTYVAQEKKNKLNSKFQFSAKGKPGQPEKEVTFKYHRIDVEFAGANPNATIVTEEPSNDYINYYTNGSEVVARHYGKIIYKNIYPGIDIEFIARPDQDKPVEYNFIVHPGADINQIRLKYAGAIENSVVANRVILRLAHGKISENIPLSYWRESKEQAKINYKQVYKNKNELMIGFLAVTPSKVKETLIIDPMPNIDWGTYFGGTAGATIYGSRTDLSGNIYIAGGTGNNSSIATAGAFQTTFGGISDIFIVKFNSSGVRQWGTYYGGAGNERASDIATDASGNVYITGWTSSTTVIATPGAHQTTYAGSDDAFLVKFDATGQRLWGTYYGGPSVENGYDVEVDPTGNVFIAGQARSSSGIASAGAHQTAIGGLDDAFLVKFNSSGVRQWGTYYGGSSADYAYSLAVDASGNAAIGGTTDSSTGIATPGAHQTVYATSNDGLLVKFNSSGVRQWATYYGGSSQDNGGWVAFDDSGNVFLSGGTFSTSAIATAGAHMTSLAGGADAYLVKFNSAGSRQWGTYFGGTLDEFAQNITTDNSGNVLLTGVTSSSSGIATADAYQGVYGGAQDCFLSAFNPTGVILWGSYYGGANLDLADCIVTDEVGSIYISGRTSSPTSIATPGSFQPTMDAPVNNSFLAKFGSGSSGICTATIVPGKNLPVWALSTVGLKDVQLNWTSSPPVISELPNSTNQTALRAVANAIDPCGQLAFYTMFTGTDVANRLHIYSSNGTKLTNETIGSPLLALNSAGGVTEVQIVQVPGTTDQWYIIYSLYQTPCSGASGYCPARVVYAKVQYNSITTALTILSRETDISSTYRYIQGKAVSSNVNGNFNQKYLYLAERAQSSTTTRFHRFIIDASGIGSREISAVTIPALFYSLTISGSTLELSHDGTTLAMVNRNENAGYQDIFVYNVSQFANASYVPITIKVPELMVDLDWQGSMIRKSVTELATTAPYNSTYSCLQYMKNKLTGIQFSPSGQYLYVTNGGYKQTSSTQRTYLIQIDIQNPDINNKYTVRIQTQNGVETGACGVVPSGPAYKSISLIQAGYDGRLYFSKGGTNTLFVIPDPDCPMPQNLLPHEVDLSIPGVPNIVFSGATSVAYMPEQIDGFTYPTGGTPVPGAFTLDKVSVGLNEAVALTINNFNGAHTYSVNWGDGVIQPITSSLPVTHSYSTVGNFPVLLTTLAPPACPAISSDTVGVTNCPILIGLGIDAVKYICAMKFSSKKLNDCSATYLWNFGDGSQPSAERNPIHAYAIGGTYNVSLSINFNCPGCVSDTVLYKQVVYNPEGNVMEDEVVQVVTDLKLQVLSNSSSTYSDSWALQHEASAVINKNEFLNGSKGVWRNDASFVYDVPRLASEPVNTKTDGTYPLEQFSWKYAELNAVPNWIKANSMTQYSPYSYELENKDVLNVFTAALYDYGGQMPVANGVNMRNKEMAFTSFEALNGLATGNFIFGTAVVPEYTQYVINAGFRNMAVVEAKPGKFQGVTKADVTTKPRPGPQGETNNFFKDNEIVCVQAHPSTPEWCYIVFKTAPSQFPWTGTMQVKNDVTPVVTADIDNTIFHSGKSSLKLTTEKTFKQELLELDSAKNYVVSCWVSVNNKQPLTPTLAPNLGFDVLLRRKNGTLISTIPFAPSGPIIEGWQQIKSVFPCSINDAVIEIRFKNGSGTAWYDDLRFHPESGNMKTYVYDVTDFRLKAILDEENFGSYFFYDAEGNLYLTKKETVEGLKTLTENISYQLER